MHRQSRFSHVCSKLKKKCIQGHFFYYQRRKLKKLNSPYLELHLVAEAIFRFVNKRCHLDVCEFSLLSLSFANEEKHTSSRPKLAAYVT